MLLQHNSLSEHLLAFGAFLRTNDFLIGPDHIQSSLNGVSLIDLGDFQQFMEVLKVCYARSDEQWHSIEGLYRDFCREYERSKDSKIIEKEDQDKSELAPARKIYQLDDIKKWLYDGRQQDTIEHSFFSPFVDRELRRFVDLDSVDLKVMQYWIGQMLKKLSNQRNRREMVHSSRGRIDLKVLLRNRFRNGDELVRLQFKYKRKEKSKIVFLCDVSRSMDLYSQFVQMLLRLLPKIFDYSSVYLFNTDLFALEKNNLSDVEMKGLWSGGTKIGTSFHHFLMEIPEWFDRRSKIIIYSDGWDTGDLDLLDSTMYAMSQKCDQIIWINPTIKEGEDLHVSGMRIANRYIDKLAAVYNIRTLKEFVKSI